MSAVVVVYNSMDAAERLITAAVSDASLVDVCAVDVAGSIRAKNWDAFGTNTSTFIALSPIGDGISAEDFADSPYDRVYLCGETRRDIARPEPITLQQTARCDVYQWYPPALPLAVGYGAGVQMLAMAYLCKGDLHEGENTPTIGDAHAFMCELESRGDTTEQSRICADIRDSITGCDMIADMTARGHGRLDERERVISAFVSEGAVFPATMTAQYRDVVSKLAAERGVSVVCL